MAGTDTNMHSAIEGMADRLMLAVPEEIRRYKQWLLWRYEPGEDKPRKVPYYVAGERRAGAQGAEHDLAHLSSFDDAVAGFRAAAGRYDGVGLAILQNSPIKAIDIDNCVDARQLIPEAEAIVNEADSYAELSPSGGGVRILVYGVLPSKKSLHHFGPGRHLELFGASGFVTITGNVLGDATLRPMSAAFQAWITKQAGAREQAADAAPAPTLVIDEHQRAELRAALNYLNADDYEQWTQVGMALKSLGNLGRGLWLEWSQSSPRYDPQQAASKWKSFQPRADGITYRSVFQRAAAAGWVNPMGFARNLQPAEKTSPEALPDALPIMSLAELGAAASAVTWAIKHVVPADSIGVIFGASQAFKSFIALDMVLHIAHGLPWLGKKTKPGRVLYIAAEGGAGIFRRVQAWHQARGLDMGDIGFFVCPVPVELSKNAAAVAARASAVGLVPDVVVVDTMSQTNGGEENSSTDTAAYFRQLGMRFRALWRCVVLVVHHSGHSATERPRGSSAIMANTDFLFGVFRDEKEMLATVECHKQKDGDLFEPVAFEMTAHVVGRDEDGEEVRSLAARHINQAEYLLQALDEQRKAGRPPAGLRLFLGLVQTGARYSDVRMAFYKELGDSKNDDARKRAWNRAVAQAKSMGFVEVVDGEFIVHKTTDEGAGE